MRASHLNPGFLALSSDALNWELTQAMWLLSQVVSVMLASLKSNQDDDWSWDNVWFCTIVWQIWCPPCHLKWINFPSKKKGRCFRVSTKMKIFNFPFQFTTCIISTRRLTGVMLSYWQSWLKYLITVSTHCYVNNVDCLKYIQNNMYFKRYASGIYINQDGFITIRIKKG